MKTLACAALLAACCLLQPCVRAEEATPGGGAQGEAEAGAADAGEDAPEADPAPGEEADATGDDSEPDESGESGDSGGDGEAGPQVPDRLPEGVKRRRPQTTQQEREYKLLKAREDPYLNPPGGLSGSGGSGGPLYDPSLWLRSELPSDAAGYVVQDAQGKVLGEASLTCESGSSPQLGAVLRSGWRDAGGGALVTAVSLSPGLRPHAVNYEADAAAADSSGSDAAATRQAQYTEVRYNYDRVTIRRDAGAVATVERMRQLPYSYDEEQLPLLIRLLDYSRVESREQWPFEALLTFPRKRSTGALSIARPDYTDCLSAEGRSYGCFKVAVALDGRPSEWWIERRAPYRLVKFIRDGRTYTLSTYSERKQGAY